VKLFSCDNCQQVLFFENSRCMSCGMNVGYCVELARMVTLQRQTGSSSGSVYEVFFPNQGIRHYRQCKNGRDHDACNWLVPAESTRQFCDSCSLTAGFHGGVSRPYIIGEEVWLWAGHAFKQERKVVSRMAKVLA